MLEIHILENGDAENWTQMCEAVIKVEMTTANKRNDFHGCTV